MILKLAGKPVPDGKELQGIVARLPVGKPAEVAILRDGQPKLLTVTIEEQPQRADDQCDDAQQPAPAKNCQGLPEIEDFRRQGV